MTARIISNFFQDGAKIVFASLVVGSFLPGAQNIAPVSFLSIASGLIATMIFLWIAVRIIKQ